MTNPSQLSPVEALQREIDRLNELAYCYEGAYIEHVSDMRKLVVALEFAKVEAELQEHLMAGDYERPFSPVSCVECENYKNLIDAASSKLYEALQK